MTGTKNKKVWMDLDHRIWKTKESWPSFRKVLVALSGGADSVALLSVLNKLSHAGNFSIMAAFIHHGPGSTENWRTETLEGCRLLCLELGIDFISGGPSPMELLSESQMREFRYLELKRLAEHHHCDWVATGHHADDLIETRMLRLLRGTGPQGMLAMTGDERFLWRPLLRVSKAEILDYLSSCHLPYFEDPSNFYLDPTRNWIRHELFPFLETRQKGFVQSLGRSLDLLVEALTERKLFPIFELFDHKDLKEQNELAKGEHTHHKVGFARCYFKTLSTGDQRQLLAEVLYRLKKKDYTQGQIEEIQRRLDNPQIMHNFTVSSVRWSVDAKQVLAEWIN